MNLLATGFFLLGAGVFLIGLSMFIEVYRPRK